MTSLDVQQSAARDWFEGLRTRICAAFEAIEREAGSDAAFDYIAWDREGAGVTPGPIEKGGGGGGVVRIVSAGLLRVPSTGSVLAKGGDGGFDPGDAGPQPDGAQLDGAADHERGELGVGGFGRCLADARRSRLVRPKRHRARD